MAGHSRMRLGGSDGGGGGSGPGPNFTTLVTSTVGFASGATPALSGDFRLTNGHFIVSRNGANTADADLIGQNFADYCVVGDNNVDTGIIYSLYVGGSHYFRLGANDALTVQNVGIQAGKPVYGDSIYSSPWGGVNGSIQVVNPDAAYNEIAANYRFAKLEYNGEITATRSVTFPGASGTTQAFTKHLVNSCAFPLTITQSGVIFPVVTLWPGESALVNFDPVDGPSKVLSPLSVVDAYANRPTTKISGQRFLTTDGPVEFAHDGSAWRPRLFSGLLGTQPPAASNFNKVGATSATLTDDKGTLLLQSTNANEVFKYTPALGGTFQIDCVFQSNWNSGPAGKEALFALAAINNASGHFYRFGVYYDAVGNALQAQLQYFNDPNTSSGAPVTTVNVGPRFGGGSPIAYRLVQDSTSLVFSLLAGGVDALPIVTIAKGTFTTADRIGFFCADTNGNQSIHRVLSFKVQ